MLLKNIPYLILSGEILPPDVKNLASGFLIFINWGTSFLVTLTFEPLEEAITTAGTFWMYSGICLLGAIAMQLTLVETKGKTLQQIQQQFVSGNLMELGDDGFNDSKNSSFSLKG